MNAQGKFFGKIYFTVAIISCIGIVLVSTIIGFNATENSKKIIMHYSSEHVKKMAQAVQEYAEKGKKIAIEIHQDKDILPILYGNEAENYEIIRALNRMDTYQESNPEVESIYVYNRSTEYIYSTLAEGRSKREHFFDTEINDFLQGEKEWKKLFPIPRTLSNGANVYSFIYFENRNIQTGYYDQAIVVNLNQKALDYVFTNQRDGYQEEAFVISPVGLLLSSRNGMPLYSDISSIDYIQDIIQEDGKAGSQIAKINNQKYLVQYKKIAELDDWIFVNLSLYSSVIESIFYTAVWCVCIVIIFSILFSLVSYWISIRIYRPIASFEKDFVELQRNYKKGKYALKNTDIQNIILRSTKFEREQIEEIIEKYKLNLLVESDTKLITIILNEEDLQNNNSFADNTELLWFALCNICDEVGNLWNPTVSAVIQGCRIVLIMNMDQVYTDEQLKVNVVEEIQKNIKKFSDIRSRGIIGETVEDMSLLQNSYQNIEVYEQYFQLMEQNILVPGDISERLEKTCEYPKAKLENYLLYFSSGKEQQADRLCKELLEEASQSTYNYFIHIVNRMLYGIWDIIGKCENIEEVIRINQKIMLQNIQQADKVEDIYKEFQSINHFMMEYVKRKNTEKKEKNSDSLVEKVDDIIRCNFGDVNLNIQYIAERLELSSAYLGRMYSKKTGKTITDVIKEERLNEACNLLRTEISIPDVVDRCGFCNMTYFYRLFKKSYGVTPNVYRINKQKGD